jgi:group II intron reverse transcriptase/maturase
MVYKAWLQVKANGGAPGIEGQSIEDFERKLEDNLYKLWNRMASGSYRPPAVRKVEIPKANGGVRTLGVPTVADRIAQAVAAAYLEPRVEATFHPDSYAYRPGKSALDAVGMARKRCWKKDWVIDLDIKGFFDNLDHELVLKAVRHHTKERWVLMYVERWLKAPIEKPDGTQEKREKGTPQGGVISPLLANLFLHYAFDAWMRRKHPQIEFERYADDIIVHVQSKSEAEALLEDIRRRLAECGLELNMAKTTIVYCKDGRRKGGHDHTSFDFLGYTFRARAARGAEGKTFTGFLPAIGDEAKKKIRQRVRSWNLTTYWVNRSLEEIAAFANPIVRGWVNYYGQYYRTECRKMMRHLQRVLIRWVQRKYKGFRHHPRRAECWLRQVAKRQPNLLAPWMMGYASATGS